MSTATPRRYRNGNATFEAIQLTTDNGHKVWEWADSKAYYDPDGTTGLKVSGLTIFAPWGRVKAEFGDWVVRGPKGEFFPVKPDLFASAYKLAT